MEYRSIKRQSRPCPWMKADIDKVADLRLKKEPLHCGNVTSLLTYSNSVRVTSTLTEVFVTDEMGNFFMYLFLSADKLFPSKVSIIDGTPVTVMHLGTSFVSEETDVGSLQDWCPVTMRGGSKT